MINAQLLELAKRVKSLAEIGLVYQENPFDVERYRELSAIGSHLMSILTKFILIDGQ